MDCYCTKSVIARNIASGRIRASIKTINNLPVRLKSIGKIKSICGKDIGIKSKVYSSFAFIASETKNNSPSIEHNHDNSNIRGDILLKGAFKAKLSSTSKFSNIYTDKINTTDITKYNQQYLEKLYPISDIETSLNNTYFINKYFDSGNLYSNIDEGILVKNYDELSSYIQPSSIYTEGSFRYKCKVSPSLIRPEDSILLIRASAPRSTYSSNIPPLYYISNIKLEDASGNLIIKYDDILVRGDADYNDDLYKNFTTYIAKPSINYANQNTWKNYYPILGSGLISQAYSLNLDFTVKCLDDPFSEGFDQGYSEGCELHVLESTTNNYLSLDGAPLSDHSQGYSLNPDNSIRITAIEICNSGAKVTLTDHYLPFYNQVSSSGQRIIRDIYPSEVLPYDYNTTIYPLENSVWSSYPTVKTNINIDGLEILKSYLRDVSNNNYITLDSTSSIPDSGKLKLVFSHERPKFVSQYTGGSFSFGGLTDQTNFASAKLDSVAEIDHFFTIDSIELKIIAKKSIGSRNYTIDAVGYSDDKLLCSTPKIGGFLQNIEGSGYIPISSGFNSINELGLGSEALSDKYQFYTINSTNNDGGDHYLISTSPVVDSIDFKEYSIPLKIYEDSVELGKSTDYSMSSYFEKLYLDIFPIPSGASISHIKLVVTYKPSNALKLHTIGHGYDELFRRIIKLNVNNDYINSSGSTLSNLPHAYKDTESTLKYNYAKRWRGVSGKIVAGPYNPYSFDFSYYNPELITPFLNGYFSFNYDSGNTIISDYSYETSKLNTTITGSYIGNYNKIQNIGLRFKSQSLFNQTTSYTTIDWTSISGYENHELKNKISDSFDNAIRVSGNLGYINFGNVTCSSGFAIFTRFSPDISMSGIGYNLWNSGVIFSKFDSGKNLEFALSYHNGKLRGSARDTTGNIITIDDNKYYHDYEYPLCIMLSYNENNDNKLRIFTNNYISESQPFNIYSDTSNLIFGYSSGSGVGVNAFITDIGISTGSGVNIISSGSINLLSKQIIYSDFISGINNGLYSYINDDVDSWHLGDFKICSFNQDYDRFITRTGSDFIIHHLKHDGSGYSQINNYSYPSLVNVSGISYHSQIENDFLRFYLQDALDVHQGFYSVQPRISKDLPRGYSFEDKAFVVETILDHVTNDNIIWPDGKRGPKLIVSLYTPNKNPQYRNDKINWGLINKHEHYLEPSGCYHKIFSTFSYEDLLNQNEPWSNYDLDRNLSEFETKYYSTDIDDMFLQYDLVFPSGSSFDSIIKFHSAQVKLENAIVKKLDNSNNLNLNIYGSGYQFDILNMALPYRKIDNLYEFSSGLSLCIDANILGSSSGSLNLYSSGTYHYNDNISLHTINFVSLDNEDEEVFGNSLFGSNNPRRFNLYVSSEYGTASPLSLMVSNKLEDQSALGHLSLLMYHKEKLQESLSLYIDTPGTLIDRFPYSTISLFTRVGAISPSSVFDYDVKTAGMSLFIDTYEIRNTNDSLPLIAGKELFLYNRDNVGKAITIDDNKYSSLSANDEIRGVETICYGNCFNGEPCTQAEIKTHDTIWYPETCVDGGLLRAKTTYTNLNASGFNTPIGYSGHFYGIRKFDNLAPNIAYFIETQCQTGNNSKINIPFELNEAEYGYNNNANYSGIKLIGDYPYCESGRNANDQYGKSVAVCGDLMVVGAPFHTLYDSGNYILENAGAVFLYRRDPQPTGYSWDYHKGEWKLEQKLTLPSSILRDYYIDTPSEILIDNILYPTKTRQWYVGQEGRQFGHSLALTKRDDKEILIVGAPSAKFNRTFELLEPSGINVGLFIFTDEFIPLNYNNILESVQYKDKIFQYFSDPPTKFNIKIIICEPIGGSNLTSLDFPEPKPSFIVKQIIDRHRNEIVNSTSFVEKDLSIYSGIKQAYDLAFPYDNTKLNNNIPAILGFYIDDSRSLGERAIQPALDNFIKYHQQYAFSSGLQDFFGYASSGSVIKSIGLEENWATQSISILNTTLDTGRLIASDEFKLFSNGIGPEFFNINLSEFNIIPNSGGAVYIFENASGQWDLKQTINSPTTLKNIKPDRFGHSVDISENGQLIVVGSPYINEAIMSFEYDKESDIYINNFKYGYSNIPFVGSWNFLTEKTCPSSRLGYSVATNEDGSIIVAGAPTDSMDEFDDTNTYYSPAREQFSVWSTYVNAGAIRLFESRKYYPHNKAIEYGVFGNLDYDHNSSSNSGLYNHFTNIYNDINVKFTKSPFGENIDIPEDVGLLFINTPYIDAFSDEIKKKIIDWLALGDRNLVLVGNDPIWENDGLYKSSNFIINKILSGLNSRMRLVPARNQYESISFSGLLNITPATRPNKSMSSYISTKNMYGSGVADIKVYAPNVYETFNCLDDYTSMNTKCALPIKDNGDLRAEWALSCQDAAGNTIPYYMNWPMKFGTVTPLSYGCANPEFTNIAPSPTIGYEPLPLLAAAEFEYQQDIIYPGVPERSGLVPTGYYSVTTGFNYSAQYGNPIDNTVAFEWSTNSSSNYSLLNTNINNTLSASKFYKPESYNNKNPLLQAKASNRISQNIIDKIATDQTYFAAEENYNDTSSKVILIAGTYLERPETLLNGLGDRNINFYSNLVSKNANGESCIAQLGGWTQTTDFTDADPKSVIKQKLEDLGNIVDSNISSSMLNTGHITGDITLPLLEYNVCWIADAKSLPSESELEELKNWLNTGNKKLIITYKSNPQSAQITKSLCDKLNISMRPLYLTEKSKFADDFYDRPRGYNSDNAKEITKMRLYLNTSHIASIGYRPQDSISIIDNITQPDPFIPIQLNNATNIVFNHIPIMDNDLVSTGLWQLKTGVAEVIFDVFGGSGYKLFIDVASEDISETQPLYLYIANANMLPSLNPVLGPENIPIYDIDDVNDTYTFIKSAKISKIIDLGSSPDGEKRTYSFSIQIPNNENKLALYFTGNNLRLNDQSTQYTPKTIRLLSVSGCAININTVSEPEIVNYALYGWEVYPAIPETIVKLPARIREISTGSNKYCGSSGCAINFDNRLIADGPIVVAQELEQISKFDNGVNRSRITLISDSSLLQGPTIANSQGVIHDSHKEFLYSLYPITKFPNTNGKRVFDTVTKIMSPERGSPQIYFTSTANSGLNIRFFNGYNNRTLSEFHDHILNYETFNRALTPREAEYSDPTFLTKRYDPIPAVEIEEKISGIINTFASHAITYGGNSKFKGIINNTMYEDVGCLGGMPKIMQDTGYDYLDFEYFKTGYPGNLFGYSVDIKDKTLFIGAPFVAYSGEYITPWSGVQAITAPNTVPSGSLVGYNGGAGSVYVYNKTGIGITPYGKQTNWSCTRKIRPTSINIGQDISDIDLLSSGFYLGSNNYIGDDIEVDTKVNDQFGHCLCIDGDILVIGAPGHDFETYYEDMYNSGAFVRKEFNIALDIPHRNIYDLGESGIRNSLNGSGISVLNNGAIYIYENKIVDKYHQTQDWIFVDKITQQGYNSRLQKTYTGSQNIPVSGSENDRFGSVIAINRTKRTDADYTIIAGVKEHKFATSGNHISTQPLLKAGSTYSYDLMLKDQGYIEANPNSWINARVFGQGSGEINMTLTNNFGLNQTLSRTGIVYSNEKGEIFLEASGQDYNINGFIEHRPYVTLIRGSTVRGNTQENYIGLMISGRLDTNEQMNLFSNAANSAIVYNNLDIYSNGISGVSYNLPSGLILYAHCPEAIYIDNSGLNIYNSGLGIYTDNFSMAVRGQ